MFRLRRKGTLAVLVLTVVALTFIVSLSASASTIISPDGWGWQNPLPQGNHLWGTWGSSASDVYAVGDYGTILHYDGSGWGAMDSGTTQDLRGV